MTRFLDHAHLFLILGMIEMYSIPDSSLRVDVVVLMMLI